MMPGGRDFVGPKPVEPATFLEKPRRRVQLKSHL
jgi:hypothetical protein